MCGIIGRISFLENPEKTIMGLKELEYRGYDSYGLYFYNDLDNKEFLIKDVGSFKVTNDLLKIKSFIEIGHTRWATHGKILKKNAHPIFSNSKKFYIVMNGIVENYVEIKKFLEEKGTIFNTDTDTEVIVQLVSYFYENLGYGLNKSIISTLKMLKGEFSFIIKFENKLICYKNINPLNVGYNENEYFLSSDLEIVEKNSKEFYILKDNEVLILTKNKSNIDYELFDYDCKKNELIRKEISFIESKKIDEIDSENNYNTFMEKEIYEQKNLDKILITENIKYLIDLVKVLKNKNKKIVLTGAGTSYHSALFMHYKLLELGILSQPILASELKNYSSVLNDSIIIAFSQSGETADLIYPLKILSKSDKNNYIISITNKKYSTISNLGKSNIFLNCGKEVSVASTKAFTFQVFISEIIEKIFFELDKETDETNIIKNISNYFEDKLKLFKDNFDNVIDKNLEIIKKISSKYYNSKDFFYIGRDEKYPLAMEGSLKLKEISYIHAEGFAGGELKHGPLALIKDNIPVVVLGDNEEIVSNAIEIKTRGGIIIGISPNNKEVFDFHLKVPEDFKNLFSIVLFQILALKITESLGLNPDKPRNLAKSVTVK